MARDVEQVGRAAAVMDGETGDEAHTLGIFMQQVRADTVEGTGLR